MTDERREEIEETAARVPGDGDPARGARPFIAKRPRFEVEGVAYELRRLGWDDCTALLAIAGEGLRSAVSDARALIGEAVPLNFGALLTGPLLAAAASQSKRVLAFAASMIERVNDDGKSPRPVDIGELRDPEIFPGYWVLRWVTALSEHGDVDAFFAEWEASREKLTAFGQRIASRLTSTGSSDKPDTPTST